MSDLYADRCRKSSREFDAILQKVSRASPKKVGRGRTSLRRLLCISENRIQDITYVICLQHIRRSRNASGVSQFVVANSNAGPAKLGFQMKGPGSGPLTNTQRGGPAPLIRFRGAFNERFTLPTKRKGWQRDVGIKKRAINLLPTKSVDEEGIKANHPAPAPCYSTRPI